jgi:hypothetical protein
MDPPRLVPVGPRASRIADAEIEEAIPVEEALVADDGTASADIELQS